MDTRGNHYPYNGSVNKNHEISVIISTRSAMFGESIRAYLSTLGGIHTNLADHGISEIVHLPVDVPCHIWLVDVDLLANTSPQTASLLAERIAYLKTNYSNCKVALIVNSRDQEKMFEKLNLDAVLMKGMLDEDLANLCDWVIGKKRERMISEP